MPPAGQKPQIGEKMKTAPCVGIKTESHATIKTAKPQINDELENRKRLTTPIHSNIRPCRLPAQAQTGIVPVISTFPFPVIKEQHNHKINFRIISNFSILHKDYLLPAYKFISQFGKNGYAAPNELIGTS